MGHRNRIAAATTALALAAALAGCSTPPRALDDAAGGGADAAAPTGTRSQGWNRADLAFAREMGDHAAGSVELAVAALRVRDLPQGAEELAAQIRDEQGPQARTLAQLAEEWSGEAGGSGVTVTEDRAGSGGASASSGSEDGAAVGAASAADREAMSDVAFDSELQALTRARGTEAARLFLQGMIARHGSAVALADGEAQRGTSTEAIELAGAMSAAQGEQLTKMRALLESIGG